MAELVNVLDDLKLNASGVDSSFVEFIKSIPSRGAVSFTEREQSILSLHDQLSEMRLEYAILESQQKIPKGSTLELSSQEAERKIKDAERDCLKARSAYLLKNSVVENVLFVDPLLKAVHAGAGGDPMERALRVLIDERDVLSMVHANLSASLREVAYKITTAGHENIVSMRKNQQLTRDLLGSTNQLKTQDLGALGNEEMLFQLKILQDETKEAKRRWRIMKSLIAAVIAGSGIDWARNDDLRELVLDDED